MSMRLRLRLRFECASRAATFRKHDRQLTSVAICIAWRCTFDRRGDTLEGLTGRFPRLLPAQPRLAAPFVPVARELGFDLIETPTMVFGVALVADAIGRTEIFPTLLRGSGIGSARKFTAPVVLFVRGVDSLCDRLASDTAKHRSRNDSDCGANGGAEWSARDGASRGSHESRARQAACSAARDGTAGHSTEVILGLPCFRIAIQVATGAAI
jgi:hypothetical protein